MANYRAELKEFVKVDPRGMYFLQTDMEAGLYEAASLSVTTEVMVNVYKNNIYNI